MSIVVMGAVVFSNGAFAGIYRTHAFVSLRLIFSGEEAEKFQECFFD